MTQKDLNGFFFKISPLPGGGEYKKISFQAYLLQLAHPIIF